MLFTSQTMSGKAKLLNESQRLELDSKLKQPNHSTDPSQRNIARRSDAAVRKVCAKWEVVRKRSALMSEDTHKS